MNKRIASLLLAACLTASLTPAVFAAPASGRDSEQAIALSALEIMSGDANGNLNLGAPVTRAQFAKMVAMASPVGKTLGDTALVSPYYDVPSTHWSASYVAAVRDMGVMRGYLDGLFHPNANIKLEEGVTVVLRLLGYTDADIKGAYPVGQLNLASTLGLDEGVSAKRGENMTRGDVQNLLYNLLSAKTKDGKVYAASLGYGLTADGKVDTVALVSANMSDPFVATNLWQTTIPFSGGNITYYRNGKTTQATSIREGDVLYYNKSMRTVWAYNNPVTGVVTALTPSAANPTAVTVNGVSYTIGTSAAAIALSDIGGTAVGDVVTLMLGRDNTVVALGSAATVGDTVQYGLITAVAKGASFTDANGKPYTSDTVTVLTTSGATQTYPVDTNRFKESGQLVKVSSENGKTTVTGLAGGGGSLVGQVTADASKVGTTPLSSTCQILDVYKSSAAIVYPARLAGAKLNSGNVRFFTKNALGEIDRIILNNVTGDMHQYGIIMATPTATPNELGGSVFGGTIECMIGGQTRSLPSSSMFGVKSGDMVQVRMDNKGMVDGMSVLTGVRINSITGNEVRSNDTTYLLADNATVYLKKDGRYNVSNITAVSGAGYTLTAYYDKTVEAGGRVRIILAT